MARFSVCSLALVALAIIAQEARAEAPERIVGGSAAGVGEFPHQVSLREGGFHNCGGSIITERHILTAAHCVDTWNVPRDYYTVVSGTNSIESGGEVHQVKAVRVHPAYKGGNKDSWINDIAVILLEKPIKFNDLQKPIELFKSDVPLNARLVLSGWGRIYKDGPLSPILLKITVSHQDKLTCQRQHPETIYPNHLCALDKVGSGGCQGDSGGPLLYNSKLAGIVSWNVPCAKGVSDVFTKVSAYTTFVETAIKELH